MDNIFQLVILVFSVIIHEISHGYAALMLGDHTARNAGRLTLNPIPHIDLFGSIIIPGLLVLSGSSILVGWAKPVPYNERNLKNARFGDAIVASAGPAANLFMALIFGVLLRISPYLSGANLADGPFGFIIGYIILINIFLAIFNLLPIPPLDGYKVFFSFLPLKLRYAAHQFEARFGMLPILLAIIFFSSVFAPVIFFITRLLFRVFTGFSF